jgi:hypothetical protein
MTIIPLSCRQCGTVEELISVMEIAPGRLRLILVSPKQRYISDPERVAHCAKHGEIWCWACWSAEQHDPLPDYYNYRTGGKLGRGESARGGRA